MRETQARSKQEQKMRAEDVPRAFENRRAENVRREKKKSISTREKKKYFCARDTDQARTKNARQKYQENVVLGSSCNTF